MVEPQIPTPETNNAAEPPPKPRGIAGILDPMSMVMAMLTAMRDGCDCRTCKIVRKTADKVADALVDEIEDETE